MTTVKTVQVHGKDCKQRCDIDARVWRQALSSCRLDKLAGIRHAELHGTPEMRLHVAEISTRVNCHYHRHGEELYQVVEGAGILHFGAVEHRVCDDNHGKIAFDKGSEILVAWQQPLRVKAGDSFVIPEGFAHQLVRDGDAPLTIIFACPDSHLADDRFLLPDSPLIENC